jgi:agmatine deiminase
MEMHSYKMPAEWEQHAATQLHWPSNRETWPGAALAKVEEVYLEIIYHLHMFETIILICDSKIDADQIKKKMISRDIDLGKVKIYSIPVNDVWARDCGPIFVKKTEDHGSEYLITDWEYNAWGGKYPPYDSDNALPEWFSKTFNLPLVKPGRVLEGGSIETNGEGIFLTTESVLLNPNRNPDLSKQEIEKLLGKYLGAQKIIWLKDGLAGDDTDGHIDDLSRFVNKNTIVTMVSDDPDDINYDTLQENLEILSCATDSEGKPFHIIELPMPVTKTELPAVDGSEYLPASYANFYIANGLVLVPLYDKTYDAEVLELFINLFPDREVEGIQCSNLVWGQGSIHCITQQLYGIQV